VHAVKVAEQLFSLQGTYQVATANPRNLSFAFLKLRNAGPWTRQSNDSNCNVSAEVCAGMDPQPYDPDLKRPLGHLIVPAQVRAAAQIWRIISMFF
jgi:hypothetical protein